MPSKSKSQQRLFGMVRQCQKTGKHCSGEIGKIAKNISSKDADDFAKTKHKKLPNKVKESMKHRTFKQFLTEVDIGDHQLAQQHQQQQQQQQQSNIQTNQARNEFQGQMKGATPIAGDIIISPKGPKYIVTGVSPQGIMVKMAGGDKTGNLPGNTKFTPAGQSELGKKMFTIG